jgi:hypothetical protein
MDTVAFYAATSALCFTLLGFWWITVQFRHAELTRDAAARRFSFLVSLHFLIPGLVSLASLLGSGILWQIAFGLGGLTGIAAVVVGVGTKLHPGPLRRLGAGAWLGVPAYAIATIVALVPDVTRTLFNIEPLQAEGLVVVAILALGTLLAWFMFTGPLTDDSRAT